MGGANVFVAPLRRRGDVPRRSTGTGARAVSSSGRWSTQSSTANADLGYDLSTFRGQRGNAAFDARVQPDRSAWGRNAGGYGQTEVMGMATFNLLGAGLGTHGRPSPLVDLRGGRGRPRVPVGEVGEIAARRTP